MFVKNIVKNKIALVTGGSRGLGKEICLKLAREGAKVAFTYNNSSSDATETLRSINEAAEGISFKTSVLDIEATTAAASKIVEKWGKIDILINNAGVSKFLPIALMEEEEWDTTLDTNLKGSFLTTKIVIRHMIRQKSGNILNIGSLAGTRILAAPVDYCSSKAGLIGLTESLAKEIGRFNIKVNCLAPGILEGGVARGIPQNKLNNFLEQLSIKREATFKEVANTVAFLVSDYNSYMTGNTVVIDGGL